MATRAASPTSYRSGPGYADDYAAWVEHQLLLLRERRVDEIDYENLIDEFGDLSKLYRNRLETAIERILTAMLVWDTAPARRTRKLAIDISLGRSDVEDLIRESPSILRSIAVSIERAYRFARINASGELDLPLKKLAELCPYSRTDVSERPFPIDEDDA